MLLVHRQLHRRPHEHKSPGVVLFETLGGKLTQRVLDHPALELFFELLRFLRLRQQIAGLYIDQPCGHFKEIRRLIVVKFFDALDILQILIQKQADLDIVNVQLML